MRTSLFCGGALAALGCMPEPGETPATGSSLYALVEGIDGVSFYPPLGPEPTASGAFEATLADGISVVVEAEAADGTIATVATFTDSTQPAVSLLRERERYFVDIPAAAYITDPAQTYTIRVLLDGSELGASVLDAHAFTVLARNPALLIGVMVRVEGSGAVRAIRRPTLLGGTPAHCTDGVRNKDETDVDCGGARCDACCTPGGECSTNPNACVAGVVSCATGTPECIDTQDTFADHSACPSGQCWSGECLRVCLENDHCGGEPIVCDRRGAGDGSGSAVLITGYAVTFGAWSNGPCGVSGSGWHVAGVDSCYSGTGGGRMRCPSVLVR
jgi:hypothetical protein